MSMFALALAAYLQQPSIPPRAPVPPAPGQVAAPVELSTPARFTGSHYKGLRIIHGAGPPAAAADLGQVRFQSGHRRCDLALEEAFDWLVEEAGRRGASAAVEVRTDPDNVWNMSDRNFICRSAGSGGPNRGTVTLIARLIRS